MDEVGGRSTAKSFVLTKPPPLPLYSVEVSRWTTTFNRLFAAVYVGGILALFYYHIVSLLNPPSAASFFISVSLLIADLILAFMWTIVQSFRMRVIRRREFPENLKQVLDESDFPTLDVFICTADPYKEPPMGVVNTALSVMAYDYPTEKISVYVSDDGGSAMTLFAFMEAAKFAGHWLPFCRKYDILERNPDAFFTSNQNWNYETDNLKIMYESMKMKVEDVMEKGKVGEEYINGEEEREALNKWTKSFTRQDHPSVIQVLLESGKDRDSSGHSLPNLIYVSRQKSKTAHHHFKAGALNTLLRVSAVMTNAPIILTLDCDMYSNDPKTPKRVLCYMSYPKVRKNLAYVQFPQRYRGISKNDIYACEFKRFFHINPVGMDGHSGTTYVGTNCFFLRRAFFGGPSSLESTELPQLGPYHVVDRPIRSQQVLDLVHSVAGCHYENATKWGYRIGIRYGSLVEDYYTGYRLHCEGWETVFCHPNRAAFIGDSPISLLQALNQVKRWAIGSFEVAFSKYSPITFGIKSMGLFSGLSFAHYAFWPVWSIPVTVYAFLPPLALVNGISIFPKVSEGWFLLYAFLFIGAYGQDLLEFLLAGSTFRRWWNEQRMWSARALSSHFFGSIEFTLKSFGISTLGFNITSKIIDQEQSKRYDQELFDFGALSPMFFPMATAAIVNLACFAGGTIGILRGGDWEEAFQQMFISGFAVVNCCPIYEAMVFRSDSGKMPPKLTFLSMFLARKPAKVNHFHSP